MKIEFSKREKGITLIALIVTIIILLILAGIIIGQLTNSGLLENTKTAKNESNKETATETINLKITNVQILTYAEKQRMPTLKELADNFCDDNDFDKVIEKTEVGSLTKISNENPTAIIAKLKAYPYEFEINSSLQLASIDGVKVATIPTNDNDTIVSMTKAELTDLINTQVEQMLIKKDYDNKIQNLEANTVSDLGKVYTSSFSNVAATYDKSNVLSSITLQPGKYVLVGSARYDGLVRYYLTLGNAISSANDTFGYTGMNVTDIVNVTSETKYNLCLWPSKLDNSTGSSITISTGFIKAIKIGE